VKAANQIALVHMFFNLTGICLFYPVPWMRLPVRIARVLGSTTATYRWFAVVYLAFMFFIFPSTMFLLSLAGPVPLYCFLGRTILTLFCMAGADLPSIFQTKQKVVKNL
jgi:sodium-dependent phosphate cotransporter